MCSVSLSSSLREAVVLESDVTESVDPSDSDSDSDGCADLAEDDELRFGKHSVKINLSKSGQAKHHQLGDIKLLWAECSKQSLEFDKSRPTEKHRRAKSATADAHYADASWFAFRQAAFERTEVLLRESLDKSRREAKQVKRTNNTSSLEKRRAQLDATIGAASIQRIHEEITHLAIKEQRELNAEYDAAERELEQSRQDEQTSSSDDSASDEAGESAEQEVTEATTVDERAPVNTDRVVERSLTDNSSTHRNDENSTNTNVVTNVSVIPSVSATTVINASLLAEIEAAHAYVKRCASETDALTRSTFSVVHERYRAAERMFAAICTKLEAMRARSQSDAASTSPSSSTSDDQKLMREYMNLSTQLRDRFFEMSEHLKVVNVQKTPADSATTPSPASFTPVVQSASTSLMGATSEIKPSPLAASNSNPTATPTSASFSFKASTPAPAATVSAASVTPSITSTPASFSFKPASTVVSTAANFSFTSAPTVTSAGTPSVTPTPASFSFKPKSAVTTVTSTSSSESERLFNVLLASATPNAVERRAALGWAQSVIFSEYSALVDRVVQRYLVARARFADDVRNRQMRFDLQKAINTPINSITPDNVEEKIAALKDLFAKAQSNEELRIFCFDTFAAIAFRIASEQMSVASANASVAMEHSIALATCIKQVLFSLSDAHRAELVDLLRYRLIRECIYFAPIDVRRVDADSDSNSQAAESTLLLRAIGYRLNIDQEMETTDAFLKRLVGSARLFAALCVAESHDERADGIDYFSPATLWRWLAAVANLELRANADLVAHLLVETLELSWYTLEQFYGTQYGKLVGVLKRFARSLESVGHSRSRAPLVRLITFLDRDATPSS